MNAKLPPTRVVFLGYRASGKTTFGRLLAKRLGYAFADVDDEICRQFGNRSIKAIWQTDGESAFRMVEVQVTQQLMQTDRMVVGLGGGTLMQDGARAAVEQASDTLRIYLQAPAQVLFERSQLDPKTGDTRPALTNLDNGLEEVQNVLAEREPIYRAVADVEIDITDISHFDRIVDQLEQIVRDRGQTGD